jgi:hypothetical protein
LLLKNGLVDRKTPQAESQGHQGHRSLWESADDTPNPEAQLNDGIPDVRDGLTREERVVLYVLHETQKERGGRNVPTAMLWGRVCEYFYISPEELSLMLARLGAQK